MKVVTGDFQKKSAPNNEIVSMLEHLLDAAKAGEIEQIAVCSLGAQAFDGFWVHGDNRGWMTVGQMHSLMQDINAYVSNCFLEIEE